MKKNVQNVLIDKITKILLDARAFANQHLNNVLLSTYWNIGKTIVEHEQHGEQKAEYGKQQLSSLSKELTKVIGRGFSVSNLQAMRRFYLEFQIQQTLSVKLTWSHYIELMSVSDLAARDFYINESTNSNWSVRELRRQIDTSLFERLLLSDGTANKQKVLELSQQGVTYNAADDFVKDPFVFEFLGIKEKKPVMEKDLESKLIKHMEQFLLELGRGFMFVGSQQRITLDGIHYYVDMVFYNKILKTYVLIDLKIGKLRAEHFGQMNVYLSYYKNEVNDPDDNDPIGIVLCADKHQIIAEYSMQGLINNVYASKYTYIIPDKDELIKQVEIALGKKALKDL